MATACPRDNRVCFFLVPAPLYVTTPGTCWWKVSHFLPWKISKRPTWISLQNALKIILKQMSAYNQPGWDLTFAAQTDGVVCMLVFTMIWDFSELKFRFLTLRPTDRFLFQVLKIKEREREKYATLLISRVIMWRAQPCVPPPLSMHSQKPGAIRQGQVHYRRGIS